MATPGATPLADLQATYANIAAQLRDMTVNPQPSYSEKGRSVSWDEHFSALTDQLAKLAKIPGVAPDQAPVYEVTSVAR